MADTWEWGPWAQQGEDYVKQQRETQSKSDLQKQQADSALKNLLAGKAQEQAYKIADEERQASNAVPALRQMLGGTPAGQQLGFTPESPDEAYRGLAKGVPGVAQTILGKQLETVPKPQVVTTPKGAVSSYFDPRTLTTTPIQDNQPNMPGLFPDIPSGEAYWKKISTENPDLAKNYRPAWQTDPTTGMYRLNLQTAEPLTAQDPIKDYYDLKKKGVTGPELEAAAARKESYINDQARMQGLKAQQTSQMTPPTVDWQNQFQKAQQAANAFSQLQSFTEPERRAFVLGPQITVPGVGNVKGLANKEAWFNYMSGLPGGVNIVNALGGKQATIDRFNQFHTLLGSIRELAFVTGGKQLTKTEEDVVLAKIPTGQERSYSEFQAKMNYATKLLKAVNDGMILANQVPKGDPNYNLLMGAVWRQAFAENGIDTRDPERNVRSEMSSGSRLRDKALGK